MTLSARPANDTIVAICLLQYTMCAKQSIVVRLEGFDPAEGTHILDLDLLYA